MVEQTLYPPTLGDTRAQMVRTCCVLYAQKLHISLSYMPFQLTCIPNILVAYKYSMSPYSQRSETTGTPC